MANCYFELRKKPTNGNGLSTDTMRHLHTRQHLGKAVIISDRPVSMLGAARKQWLKLSRHVQNQRAATLDADKILKYTHVVTHMQHMRFTAKSPLEDPDADAFFISPEAIDALPGHCLTVYVAGKMTDEQAEQLTSLVTPNALIVDYVHQIDWEQLGCRPKHVLESQLTNEWQRIEQFLATYRINSEVLFDGPMHNVDAIDEALDVLLGASGNFLSLASDFNQALELARPLKISKQLRRQYDAVTLLAHRVQALTPGAFTRQFLETYSEDDTFFLHDAARKLLTAGTETLAQAVERHLNAGRVHLASALRSYSCSNKLT